MIRLAQFQWKRLVCLWAGLQVSMLCAQSTLYWAGNANDPQIGGEGTWGTTNQSWSYAPDSYDAATWSDRPNNTDSAVLGGDTAGVITMDRSLHGSTLTVTQDYTIHLPSEYSRLSFNDLIVAGSGTRLTFTGPGKYSGQLTMGTVVLGGPGTWFELAQSSTGVTGGVIVAHGGTIVRNTPRGSSSNDTGVQLRGDAKLQSVGGSVLIGPVESYGLGDGIIENGDGLRAGSVTINVPSGNVEYSGLIRDSGTGPQSYAKLGLRKQGPGILTLSGDPKTYTGGTIIHAGALRAASANVLPESGSVSIQTGALALDADQVVGNVSSSAGTQIQLGGADLTLDGGVIDGIVTGTGRLIKVGSSTLTLSRENSFTGGMIVEGGTLKVGHAGALGAGPALFKAGTGLTMDAGELTGDVVFESGMVNLVSPVYAPRVYSGSISGGATLNIGDGGEGPTLTGTNTHTGGTKITNSTLTIGADSALGDPTGALTMENGKLRWTQAFDLSPTRAITLKGMNTFLLEGFSTTVRQAINGTGGLQLGSAGTVFLQGTNGFAGGLSLNAGTVVVGTDAALGAADGSLVLGSGALRFSASVDWSAARSLSISPHFIGQFTISGIHVDEGALVTIPVPISNNHISISQKASLVKHGAGVLRLDAPAAYDGPTYIRSGTLQLGAANDTLPVNQSVILSGGDLDLAGNSQTVDRVQGSGRILLNGGALTLTATADIQLYGGFVGSGTVRKTGGGVFSMGVDEGQFGGTFWLDAGTLNLSNANSVGGGSRLVLAANTALIGFGMVGELEVETGALVSPGNVSGSASIAAMGAGRVSWAPGSIYAVQWRDQFTGAQSGWDRLQVAGRMDVTATAQQPMVIKVSSVDSNSNAGFMSSFDPSRDYAVSIITTTDGIVGLTAANVALDLSEYQNSYSGTFRLELANGDKDLNLRYLGRNLPNWTAEHFSESELADMAISGPAADPDSDGFSNLLEYALGLDPRSAETDGLPVTTSTATDWVYTYERPLDLADITYEVEVSTDLVAWTTVGVSHERVSSGAETEVWHARYPLSAAPTVFFRLKIARP